MDEYYGSYPVGPSRKQVILRLAIAAAAILIIGIFVVWLIFFRHPKAADVASKTGKAVTSQQGSSKPRTGSTTAPKPSQSKGDTTKNNSSGNTSSTASNAGTSEATPNPTSSTSKSNSSTQNGTTNNTADLSQTGPGSVIGLFAVTVITAGALRRWQLTRRSMS